MWILLTLTVLLDNVLILHIQYPAVLNLIIGNMCHFHYENLVWKMCNDLHVVTFRMIKMISHNVYPLGRPTQRAL